MANRRGLTEAQIKRTLRPSKRTESKRGMTYVPQFEIRAELIRTFGPGNVDHTMSEPLMIFKKELHEGDEGYPTRGGGKTYYITCYMVGCTLRVRDYDGNPIYECTEYHVEANAPLPDQGEAHAMAVTSAQSYALRRAAISLGDAFGLHLYDEGGKNGALVGGTLAVQGDPDSPTAPKPVQPSVLGQALAAGTATASSGTQTTMNGAAAVTAAFSHEEDKGE